MLRKHSIFAVVLLVVIGGLSFSSCEKQSDPPVSKAEPPAAAETPKQPQPGGHFHADGTFHAEPHAPPQEVVEDTSPAQPQVDKIVPQVTLPYPMTPENRHQWETVLTAAAEDPELLQTLLPRTEAQGEEMLSNILNCDVSLDLIWPVRAAIYRELCKIAPNNFVWFMQAARSVPQKTDAEKRVVIEYWEEAKRLAKAQGTRIQTGYLGSYYRDLGEYEKAIAEIRDQWDLIDEMERTGRTHRFMYKRLLPLPEVDRLQKLLDEQRLRQDR